MAKGGKRANGEGSIYKRTGGGYAGALTYETAGGERKRATVYGATRAEVRDSSTTCAGASRTVAPPVDSRMLLGAWLDRWSAVTLEASNRRPSTRHLYRTMIRLHLNPGDTEPTKAAAATRRRYRHGAATVAALGTLRVCDLRPLHVEATLLDLAQRGYSAQTRRTVLQVLRSALDTAVREGLLRSNPAAAVDHSQRSTSEATFYTPEQVAHLLATAAGQRLALLVLVAHTGLRIGEVLGLGWQDVDLTAGTVRVRRTVYRIGWQGSPSRANPSRSGPGGPCR